MEEFAKYRLVLQKTWKDKSAEYRVSTLGLLKTEFTFHFTSMSKKLLETPKQLGPCPRRNWGY